MASTPHGGASRRVGAGWQCTWKLPLEQQGFVSVEGEGLHQEQGGRYQPASENLVLGVYCVLGQKTFVRWSWRRLEQAVRLMTHFSSIFYVAGILLC